MKKQFFYAALAIGMMSSCTSSDLPGNQAPEEQLPEEERVAIELGIQAPGSSITASTKSSTGAVGGMDDETNLWKGQKLYVVAYNKGLDTKVIDTETGDYIFEGLEFKAPTQTWNTGTSEVEGGDKIYILQNQSTVQAVYYNPTGNMDFYGYHIDEAGDGRTTGVLNGFTVENLTIDGAQDLLGARTKEVNDENYPSVLGPNITAFNGDDPVRGFSAWAARRGIQPILDFKHLLTRFTFTVEAAEKTAAEWFWDGSTWIQNVSTESEPASTAVKIKKIIIKDVSTNVDIVLFDEQAAPYVKVREASPTEDLELQGRASGSSIPLTATAAKVFDNSEQSEQEAHKGSWSESNGSYSLQTPVGESLMIPAGNDQITLHIELEQHVVDTENLDSEPQTYKDKTGTVEKTLNFSEVRNGAESGSGFAAGASYAVNIKVFSFQRIEITAALSKWEKGGDLNVDAE